MPVRARRAKIKYKKMRKYDKQTMNTKSIKELEYPLSYKEKLELADWIKEAFSWNRILIALTGSILLKELGIIDREPQDIDFIIVVNNANNGYYTLPPFAKNVEFEVEDGHRVLKSFYWLGTKVEIIHDEESGNVELWEEGEEANIKIVEGILKAKKSYLETEVRPEQIAKHTEDIQKIEQWLASH